MKNFLEEGFRSMWDLINYKDYSESKESLFNGGWTNVHNNEFSGKPCTTDVFKANIETNIHEDIKIILY